MHSLPSTFSLLCLSMNRILLEKGTINIKGMGAPVPYDEKAMSTELTCFKGFTPKSFSDLVQKHVQEGYPLGQTGTEVERPFTSVLNYGADGTCALVLAVRHMLEEKGKTIDEVRLLDESSYEEIQKYIRYEMSFSGASGPVSFTGNDNPGTLGVYQLIGQEDILVGSVGWNDAKNMDIDQNLMDIRNEKSMDIDQNLKDDAKSMDIDQKHGNESNDAKSMDIDQNLKSLISWSMLVPKQKAKQKAMPKKKEGRLALKL